MIFDTLLDFVRYYRTYLQEGSILETTDDIHGVNLSFAIYREGDLVLDQPYNFSKNIQDGLMQVLICDSLQINSGVILTPNVRCKGFTIYCQKLINNGTISMTARGAKAAGQNIYLLKNAKTKEYEFVPALGALRDTDGIGRQTGGGATGYVERGNGGRGGYGARGTSYSGGSGGGSTTRSSAGNAEENGGRGGNAGAWSKYSAGGGAGNPAGSSAWASGWGYTNPQNGTGGLLILYAGLIQVGGRIEAKGCQGGRGYSMGGSSGSGSINVFYRKIEAFPMFDVAKVATQAINRATFAYGGKGTATIQQFSERYFLVKDDDEVLIQSQ